MIAPASRAAALATASSLSYVSGGATADQIIILFVVDGETMADGGKTSPRRLLAVVIIAFVVTRIPLMLGMPDQNRSSNLKTQSNQADLTLPNWAC